MDWCESHKVETIRTNVVGTLTLADVCRDKGLMLINYATECIFEYDSGHTLGSGIRFNYATYLARIWGYRGLICVLLGGRELGVLYFLDEWR